MPASRDPRGYVRPVPLPIPLCKGVKILARDTFNFNPEQPSREIVRKDNFERRQTQMSVMGFKSLNHKPYVGIGDPFYLDEKKMILHALGQWNEEETYSSSSSDGSDNEDDNKGDNQSAFTAANLVLRRSRKDLNTLNKATVHGRSMIRNVRLGHALFDLIQKEKEDKKAASAAAFKKQQELLRNEFQPPKTESDEDSDDEIVTDVNITNYMIPVAPPTFMTDHHYESDEDLGIVNDFSDSDDQSPEREPEIVTFSGMAMQEDEEEYVRARSVAITSAMADTFSRPASSRKKKQQIPRPYTPQHTNLSTHIVTRERDVSSSLDGEMDIDITKDALFRQLCVLHWILEAMSTDPPAVMTPIMSSWSLADIGGSRAKPTKILKDKQTETGWTTFLSREKERVSKRLSNMRRSPHARRTGLNLGQPRNSIQSSGQGSQQGSTTEHDAATTKPQLKYAPVAKSIAKLSSLLKPKFPNPIPTINAPAVNKHGGDPTSSMGAFLQMRMKGGLNSLSTQMSLLAGRHVHEEPKIEEEDDQAYNKSIFKFLDEYYESLKKEEEKKKKEEEENKSTSSVPTSPVPDNNKLDKEKRHKSDRSSKKSKKRKEDSENSKEKRLDHKVAVALGEEEKMSSKYLRANAHLIRPKSSPALIEFQATLPSNKKSSLRASLHNQFAECREEKALTLHDILDHKESQRQLVCHSKFVSLQNMRHGSSFHRAIEEMRAQSWQRLRKPINERKKSTIKGNWYMELSDKIPVELKQEWYYTKILQKLGHYGLVEGTGKQSIYKFLKVLQGLREWEICSPDITAAIEFCRERIVEMTVEEYEGWFKHQFPKVTRPQTAPAKSEKKEDKETVKAVSGSRAPKTVTGSSSPVSKPIQRRAVQSAFASRRVQH